VHSETPDRILERMSTPDEVARVLLDNRARFLGFLERRVGSRDVAEDLLQEALVRGLDRARSLRDQESAVAWFYRLLRNALTDHYRRRGAERRALERLAAEPLATEPLPDEELLHTVCACVASLLDTLKPEYAAIFRRVELEGLAVGAFAAQAGNHSQQRGRARASRPRGPAAAAPALLPDLRRARLRGLRLRGGAGSVLMPEQLDQHPADPLRVEIGEAARARLAFLAPGPGL
jgi:RNA polymerase sigma factor (sigma-70 family)